MSIFWSRASQFSICKLELVTESEKLDAIVDDKKYWFLAGHEWIAQMNSYLTSRSKCMHFALSAFETVL